MAASSADADVSAAIATAWDANAPLTSAIPAAKRLSGRLPILKADGSATKMVAPYAAIDVIQSREPGHFAPIRSGDSYWDYRKATIAIRQIGKQACGDLLGKVRAVFPAASALTIPNATWKRTKLLAENVTQDPAQKAGDDIWLGTLELEIWSLRTEP